jgi:sulfur-oxidizing protein SoxY
MNPARRAILRGTVPSTILAVAVAAGLLRPRQSDAADALAVSGVQNRVLETLRALQSSNPTPTNAIQIRAPDIAENGASVFIDFACMLPDVDALVVFVDRNPQPLVAAYQIAPEVVPALAMRVKVAQTANILVVARSGGRFFRAAKTVKVTIGGCGMGLN